MSEDNVQNDNGLEIETPELNTEVLESVFVEVLPSIAQESMLSKAGATPLINGEVNLLRRVTSSGPSIVAEGGLKPVQGNALNDTPVKRFKLTTSIVVTNEQD